MNKQDLTTGLNKDLKDLRTYEALATVLKAGYHIEGVKLEGIETSIDGLKACIEHKEAMIAKMDEEGEPEPTTTFEGALAAFVARAQEMVTEHYTRNFPRAEVPQLVTSTGRRYIKVIRQEHGVNGSVYCFVDRTNGDVLKAASWKAPAKHARGNIYSPNNGTEGVSPYGGRYL